MRYKDGFSSDHHSTLFGSLRVIASHTLNSTGASCMAWTNDGSWLLTYVILMLIPFLRLEINIDLLIYAELLFLLTLSSSQKTKENKKILFSSPYSYGNNSSCIDRWTLVCFDFCLCAPFRVFRCLFMADPFVSNSPFYLTFSTVWEKFSFQFFCFSVVWILKLMVTVAKELSTW